MATTDDNRGLYFIVGALVVVVALIGFFYLNTNDSIPGAGPAGIETSAGDEGPDTDRVENSLEIDTDDDGAALRSTTERTE